MAKMRYQPQSAARISPTSPLRAGLVSYMLLTGKSYADSADGSAWTLVPGATPSAYDGAQRGMGLRVKGASTSHVMRPAPAAISASASQPVTFRFRLYLHSALTTAILSWGNTPQDGAPRFYVRLNVSSQLQVYASGYIVNCPVVAEREYIVTHTSNGATRLTYLNGVLVGTDSAAWNGNANNFYLGNGYDNTNATTDFVLSDFAVWNRVLSASEVKADSDNPWALFDAPEEEDYLSAGGLPASVTGALAATMPAPLMSASSLIVNAGQFSANMAAPTFAASGIAATPPSGTFAATMAAPVMTSAGFVLDAGQFSATMPAPSMAAIGTAAPHATGTFAVTMPAPTMNGFGFLGGTAPAAPVRPYKWRILRRNFAQIQ